MDAGRSSSFVLYSSSWMMAAAASHNLTVLRQALTVAISIANAIFAAKIVPRLY
jgi:hypothetical protein